MAFNDDVPLDGLDWDIEGSVPMAQADVLWISAELKRLRGSRFAITMAPNGTTVTTYLPIAVALQQAGNLTMFGQQFYDYHPINVPNDMLFSIEDAIQAGIPQAKYALGQMVGPEEDYVTVSEAVDMVNEVKTVYPNIKGGYLWEHARPKTAQWANQVAPLLLA